jgi:hypothetical protein
MLANFTEGLPAVDIRANFIRAAARIRASSILVANPAAAQFIQFPAAALGIRVAFPVRADIPVVQVRAASLIILPPAAFMAARLMARGITGLGTAIILRGDIILMAGAIIRRMAMVTAGMASDMGAATESAAVLELVAATCSDTAGDTVIPAMEPMAPTVWRDWEPAC